MLSVSKLKQHMQAHKSCSLQQLRLVLQEDDASIRMLMQHLIDKGKVCERRLTANCGTKCQNCSLTTTLIYEWRQ